MGKLNLVTATTWFYGKLDIEDVPSKVQLVTFHLIKLFNSNRWSPLPQISVNKLHVNANLSERTVKTALDDIIQRGWLIKTSAGYVLNTNARPAAAAAYEEDIARPAAAAAEKEEKETENGKFEFNREGELPPAVLAILNRKIS